MKSSFKNNNYKGILYMLFASLFFAINDAFVKYAVKLIGNDSSLYDVVFVRGFIVCILIIILLIFFGKINIRNLFNDKRAYTRGFFEVLTAFAFLISLMFIPMAYVYTLLNTTPLIITAAAAIFLKERVGVRRWSAVIIGFIGVLIVVNPGDLKFDYFFILPILSAVFLTVRDLVTKGYKDKSKSLEIIFVTSFLVTISFGIVACFYETNLSLEVLLYIIISSVTLTIAYFFSVLTILYAPLSLTSSTRYSVIVFGIILGYIFFSEIPSINTIIGAVIISLSGLFVIQRQKKLGKIN